MLMYPHVTGGHSELGDGNTQLMGGGWGGWCDLSVNHWQFFRLVSPLCFDKVQGHHSADPRALIPVTPPSDRESQSVMVSSVNHFFLFCLSCVMSQLS